MRVREAFCSTFRPSKRRYHPVTGNGTKEQSVLIGSFSLRVLFCMACVGETLVVLIGVFRYASSAGYMSVFYSYDLRRMFFAICTPLSAIPLDCG
ncbi:hypothetical protein TcasGA2_TC031693 [Tribolium castaneum]|uniref:Uncharacterized protein n=1 Tax=Tribolium castaneum TaxID=7070 RepID=A0A139W8Q5_TRICA|nr:hypothetical protein TcasGA2_TC031693 [Tribolium castaneum]